jgi:phosphoribosylaminoimidazole-succinocarboxamide synthase
MHRGEVELRGLVESVLDARVECTDLPVGIRTQGKVRERYEYGDQILLVASDRVSAFDRILDTIPLKGQVLTQCSLWWFHKTRHIVDNHVIDAVDPQAVLCKKAQVFPIEFVVRGFITGSTGTSMWTHYANGVRDYCGHVLPEGLVRNQRLEEPLVTPTTKEEHDRLISPEEIVAEGIMSKEDWEFCSRKALELFKFGQAIALERGLLLVDTKYEFGRDLSGKVILVDEIHTPDSSRYWIASSFEDRFARGLNPENIDKDILRHWFRENCDPYKDKILPKAPKELVVTLAARYVMLFEMITGEPLDFEIPKHHQDVACRILDNVRNNTMWFD